MHNFCVWIGTAVIVLIAVIFSTAATAATERQNNIKMAFQKISDAPLPAEEKAAQLEVFSKRFGVDALEPLAGIVAAYPRSETGSLAIKAIGMVGGAPAVATMTELITQHRFGYAQQMIFTLAEMPDTEATQQIRRLSLNSGLLEHRLAATVAMRWRGELSDIQKIKAAAESTKDPRIKRQLILTAESIEFRLTQLPSGMTASQWKMYQRRFWPEVIVLPPNRGTAMAHREAALRIQRKGAPPPAYLKRMIGREMEGAQAVAVQLLGMQKQTDQVDTFFLLAQGTGPLGRAGLNALIEIGNDQAVDRLADLLIKENFGWPSMAVEGLVKIGTQRAAMALEHAAEYTRNEELAGYCRRAAARIRNK